jgi:hypothetical protein
MILSVKSIKTDDPIKNPKIYGEKIVFTITPLLHLSAPVMGKDTSTIIMFRPFSNFLKS